MTSINLKVIGLTRPGFENVRSGFESVTFGFPNLPEREAGALTHSTTLTGQCMYNVFVGSVYVGKYVCVVHRESVYEQCVCG